jgi:hypothetical protein
METQHRLEKEALQAEVMRLGKTGTIVWNGVSNDSWNEKVLLIWKPSDWKMSMMTHDDPNQHTRYESLSSADRGTSSSGGYPSSRLSRRKSSTTGSSPSSTQSSVEFLNNATDPCRRHRPSFP